MLNIDRMLIAQMAKIILRFPPSDKKILPPPPRKISRSPNWAGISLHLHNLWKTQVILTNFFCWGYLKNCKNSLKNHGNPY